MSDCVAYERTVVPLIRAVNAAIIDTYEDIGKTQQRYTHWGARILKTLNRQILKNNKRYVTITINRNTNTATLPVDFYEETFVGLINEYGEKIRLKLRNDLANEKAIQDIECVDKCPKCNQPSSICNEMTVTESTVLVTINDSIYEQTIIKKLYPNGDYYLETRIPLWDIEAETVVYTTNKEFVTNISLKPCGCIDDTPENLQKVSCCCPDVYACYYAPCNDNCIEDNGGYKIFEETGVIQFDRVGKFKKVYLEYNGFLLKKNGQYQVPEVAFETVVAHIKFMAIDGKRNIANVEKRWRWDQFVNHRRNMEKELGRIDLGQIIQSIGLTPKFDIDYPPLRGGCLTAPAAPASSTIEDIPYEECTAPNVCPPASSTPSAAGYVPFAVSAIAGAGNGNPVVGVNTFQDDRFIGAIGINMIVVNNTNETIAAQQFSLNTTTGVLTRYQGDGVTAQNWQAGDVLIVPTFFKYVS